MTALAITLGIIALAECVYIMREWTRNVDDFIAEHRARMRDLEDAGRDCQVMGKGNYTP